MVARNFRYKQARRKRKQVLKTSPERRAGYKEPLPRAGSFTSSIALLVHSSLNSDGPVLTGGFPFLSDLRFPGGIIIIKQQSCEERHTGLASTNVGQLAQPFVNSNRNVFMDGYFTSYSIAQHLLEHDLTAIGLLLP
ncbi:hypothetical protein T06_12542 [Trichinella sp. T6]|nr:hypothetical protein T06_12542 [Trichinella sp. T6]